MSLKHVATIAAVALMGATVAAPTFAASSTPSTSLVEISDNDVMVSALGMKVGDLTGKDIYGIDGKKIGDVGTVLADSAHNAQAVTVDVGGFLGVGTKNVIVPLKNLKAGPKPDTLSTAMTKDQIEKLSEWKQ